MKKRSEGFDSDWFLLRGLTRESGHWGDFPKLLETQLPGVRVHCLDLQGTGIYWEKKSPLRIGEMVESLRRDFQKVPHGPLQELPRFLLSISLGAMVAIEWAARYPSDFRGVVLINPSVSRLSRPHKRLRWQAIPKIAKAFLSKSGELRERYVLEATSNTPANYETTAARYAEIQRLRPVSRINFFRQIAAALRFKLPDSKPPTPMLLLNSQGDKLVDPSCSEALQRKWKLPQKSHSWGGHDLPLDDPDWVLENILSWISGL